MPHHTIPILQGPARLDRELWVEVPEYPALTGNHVTPAPIAPILQGESDDLPVVLFESSCAPSASICGHVLAPATMRHYQSKSLPGATSGLASADIVRAGSGDEKIVQVGFSGFEKVESGERGWGDRSCGGDGDSKRVT